MRRCSYVVAPPGGSLLLPFPILSLFSVLFYRVKIIIRSYSLAGVVMVKTGTRTVILESCKELRSEIGVIQ